MTEPMWIRSHVERCLQAEWDVCTLSVDDDGDYPFRMGTAACWVRVFGAEPTMVRVFAHAALGLKRSAKLLTELNAIQAELASASLHLSGGVVVVCETISPIGLTPPVLAQAMRAVGGVADDIGPLLAGMYGGVTPFAPAEETTDEEAH